MPETTKAMTLRLPVEMSTALEAIAAVDRVSVAQEIRDAVAGHIETRRHDKVFQERLRRLMDENREILARLAE